MPWPLPQPAEISERLKAGFERSFVPVLRARGSLEPVDARSTLSVLRVLAEVQGMGAWDLYLWLQRLAQELLPDQAQATLERHADVWGVPRRPAAAASFPVTFAGSTGVVLPAGLVLSAGDVVVQTTAGGTLVAGTLSVPAVAAATGPAGNLDPGTVLSLQSPVAGLSVQGATVAAPRLIEGVAEEDLEAWRARLLQRIREGVSYGQASGWEAWARAVPGVAVAKVLPGWLGLGSVGVAVAMDSLAAPRVPTAGEIAAVQAALDAQRPVTALAVALGVELVPVNLSLRLDPDTAAVRAAVTAAFALHLQAEPGVGGTLRRSRLVEALSAAAGEYAHRLDLPAGDVALTARQLAVPGTITWLAS